MFANTVEIRITTKDGNELKVSRGEKVVSLSVMSKEDQGKRTGIEIDLTLLEARGLADSLIGIMKF